MREIKFRALRFNKTMDYFEITDSISCNAIGLIESGDRSELMQYTGLKDKNGKESYHKDVCKDDFGNLWVVDWSDEYAGFEFTLLKSDYKEFPKLNICRMVDMMEVIGNIYENPELAEVK